MPGYYESRLAGERLRRCYDLAPPRVRQYLEAEIRHIAARLRSHHAVLELGCGYGRIAFRLAEVAGEVVGIDVATESIRLARQLDERSRCVFQPMDALTLDFPDGRFDVVVCAQNGICAFHVDQIALLREALRVTRPGGRVLLSTYSDRIWNERLAWFEAQAAAGLVGSIDRTQTRDGVIVCEDGFRAGRMTAEGFEALCATVERDGAIEEVDDSVLFCEVVR